VAQKLSGGGLWEMYAWGRRYQSADGQLREFRFLRFGTVSGRTRDPSQIAIAVYAAAFGVPAPWPAKGDWAQPFNPAATTEATTIRIADAGLADGSRAVHLEVTRGEAQAFFIRHGRQRIREIVVGGAPRPGSSCGDCKLITACGTLPRIPGLLGLPSRRAALRTVSVSDLRYYRSCPAQAHLSALNLPPGGYGPQATLGLAVHAWLENLHQRGGGACQAADMPETGEDWAGGKWQVSGPLADLGSRMLAHHPSVCAFGQSGLAIDVRVEPRLAFHDTAAQAIVLAKPDMVYLEDGSWVWRELKTTQRPVWFNDDLLDEFPQLALAVTILAEGGLGGDRAGSRVELEVLRPDGSEVILIDPSDPGRVAKARSVLRGLAEPWRDDEEFTARPGPNCQRCLVSQWCPSFAGASASIQV
jgi:hypothetical protein